MQLLFVNICGVSGYKVKKCLFWTRNSREEKSEKKRLQKVNESKEKETTFNKSSCF